MATEAVTITGEGVSVTFLIWQKFRRRRPGFLEQVLALNPGLADLGVYLPRGTVVLFPIEPKRPRIDELAIALWD